MDEQAKERLGEVLANLYVQEIYFATELRQYKRIKADLDWQMIRDCIEELETLLANTLKDITKIEIILSE